MKLTFSPVRTDAVLAVSVKGDVLTLNGQELDFSSLKPGSRMAAETVACPWISGVVSRDAAGKLTVPLILPHGANAPSETLFPAPIETVDGPVVLPPPGAEPEFNPTEP